MRNRLLGATLAIVFGMWGTANAAMCENPRTGATYMVGGDRVRQECKRGHVEVSASDVLPDIGSVVEDYIALHPEIIPSPSFPTAVRRIIACTFTLPTNVVVVGTCSCNVDEVWETAGLFSDGGWNSRRVTIDVAPAKIENGPFTDPFITAKHHIAHFRLWSDVASVSATVYVRCMKME